jgi:hypothetical protein
MLYRSCLAISTLALAHQDGEKANRRLVRMTPCEWSIEQGRSIHPGLDHGPYRDLAAPLLFPILFDMGLRRFRLRVDRLLAMAMREVGMVCGFLVRAGFMMLGRFLVMTRGVLVMLGGFPVMGCRLF